MSRVDPGDDTIERFIVRHYRYDPARRERRHVVVAAFDNEREFLAYMAGVQAEIAGRQDAADPREHASGVIYEPGYLRRAANGHLLSRAIKHRAAGSWVEELELPSNMSVFRSGRNPGGAEEQNDADLKSRQTAVEGLLPGSCRNGSGRQRLQRLCRPASRWHVCL